MGRSACNCCGCPNVDHYCNPWNTTVGGNVSYNNIPISVLEAVPFSEWCNRSLPLKDPNDIFVSIQSKSTFNTISVGTSMFSDIDIGSFTTGGCDSNTCYKGGGSIGGVIIPCQKAASCKTSGKYLSLEQFVTISSSKIVKLYKGRRYVVDSISSLDPSVRPFVKLKDVNASFVPWLGYGGWDSEAYVSLYYYEFYSGFGSALGLHAIGDPGYGYNASTKYYDASSNIAGVYVRGPFKLCEAGSQICCSKSNPKDCINLKNVEAQVISKPGDPYYVYDSLGEVLNMNPTKPKPNSINGSKEIIPEETAYYNFTAYSSSKIVDEYSHGRSGANCASPFGSPYSPPTLTVTHTIKRPVQSFLRINGIEPEDYCEKYDTSTQIITSKSFGCQDHLNNFNYYSNIEDFRKWVWKIQ